MNISELRELQAKFENTRINNKEHYKEMELMRSKFVKKFKIPAILDLSIDEYIVGKGSKDSFCYWIENELMTWGNIHGSTSKKFGIWYGTLGKDKMPKYRIGKSCWGNNVNEAFDNIKRAIVHLIEYGEKPEYISIQFSKLSPMFKGKILTLYYPEKFLSTYSANYLNYFINHLGLNNSSKSEIDKQRLLVDFKNSDLVMKHWSLPEFNSFLYDSFGHPGEEKEKNKTNAELKDYLLPELPPIENTLGEFVTLNTLHLTKQNSKANEPKAKINHEAQAKRNNLIGSRGELVVLNAEIKKLKDANRLDLAKKVKQVSKENDRLGYDIESIDLNENPYFIEVKSTIKKEGAIEFHLTSAEHNKALEKQNSYKIYMVYEVNTLTPKIVDLSNPFINKGLNVELSPTNYRVTVSKI
jgi:hypothetical protein